MDKLENVEDIAMHGDGFGYAVGESDMILKLDPMLQTWSTVQVLGMNWSLKAVDYVDGSNGEIVAAGGPVLLLSTNGGTDWAEVAGAPAGIVA